MVLRHTHQSPQYFYSQPTGSEIMRLSVFILLCSSIITEGRHFDGGIINWTPINPYGNSTSVGITITQSYAWAYPIITCANNVPITTSGRSTQNWNLTCVVDCSTDGGYSTQPIDMLTDCTSFSSSLGMMNSQRSHNLTLTAGAHFYLANVGSAWVALNDPAVSGLQWSIITLIDLRLRPDGFINTPPIASIVSPQYTFVNQTIGINIPVSDVNVGDDVRCRWSTYTAGFRRRKRTDNEERTIHKSIVQFDEKLIENQEFIHIRKKRSCPASTCSSGCPQYCECDCNQCDPTVCANNNIFGVCGLSTGCAIVITTTISTTIATTTTTDSTIAISSITVDTPGTLEPTSSYSHRQAIDECGGICYPASLPTGTTLSDCTITFTGLKAGTWYGVAVQVEDFINHTSTTPMSSVPVQFLIYVLPQPACSMAPVFLPINLCLEVQVGVSISISIYAMNLCNQSVANITDIIVSSGINGMSTSNLTTSPTNFSLSYAIFTWTPQANQVGSQQLCVIAFTSEKVQSNQSCIMFTVKYTSDICVTTTTTSTSTTSESTTTTSETTTSASTTSISTSTATTTTSVTDTTSTSTTATTATTTAIITETTSTGTSEKANNWLLILGSLLSALLLVLCCACCCLFCFLWDPAARRRRRRIEEQEKEDAGQKTFLPRNIANPTRKGRAVIPVHQPRTSSKNHPTDNIPHIKDSMTKNSPSGSRISLSGSKVVAKNVKEEENIVSSMVSTKRLKRTGIMKMNNTEKRDETHKRNSSITRQNTRNTMLTIPSNRSDGVVVTKIPRKLTASQSHYS